MENDKNTELELEQNETSVEDTDIETDESPTTDEVDYKALYEQERAQKAKLKRKLYSKEAPITKTNQEPDEDLAKTVKRLAMIEEKRQFGFEQGLSPEETDAVFRFANGKPTKETLEHPFVKAGIDQLRASKRIENNTPSSSQRSPVFGGKTFKEMSEEDRQKAFESKMQSLK